MVLDVSSLFGQIPEAIAALAVFIIFLLLLNGFQWALFKLFHHLTKRTKNQIDDKLIEKLQKPARYFLAFLALWFGLLQFNFGDYAPLVNNLLLAVFVIFIANFIIVFFNVVVHAAAHHLVRRTNSSVDEQFLDFTHKVTLTIIWIISGVVILSIFGVQVAPILASLGIAGIAIGLGLQDTLKNIFGGISIILDKEYKVGDIIKLENGIEGTVHELGLRSTRIKTYDDELVIVPNGVLANEQVHNFAQPNNQVRVTVPFSVAYGTEVKRVREVVEDALKSLSVLPEPALAVKFLSMGDFSLNFRAEFYINIFADKSRGNIKDEANECIYNALNAAGISIPFPTTVVQLKKE